MKTIILALVLCIFGILGCDTDKPIVYKNIDFDIATICVEGHIAYVAYSGGIKGITMKIDNDGKPIKCEGK